MKKFSVTKNGEELHPSLYTWDEKTKTFGTNENDLVLNFTNWNRVTFKTGYGCAFDTGWGCTFNTGGDCTFKTGSYCTFNTGSGCTSDTGWSCTFDTGWSCTFDTGSDCTFKTGNNCTFKTKEKCVIINRATNEVIRLNNEENHYDMKEKLVKFEKDPVSLTISGSGENLKISGIISLTKLEQTKQIFADEIYNNILKEIFNTI